jgi:hypothetical protein
MAPPEALARGRVVFERNAWSDAFRELAAADREAALDPGRPRSSRHRRLLGEQAAPASTAA